MNHDVELVPMSRSEKNEMITRDESSPRSIVNLVPETVATAIKNLPDYLIDVGEGELRSTFLEKRHMVSTLDDRVRFMFWKEYDRAQTNLCKMKMNHVYFGICSREAFDKIFRDKHRTAWVLCPPVEYMLGCEEALTYGLEQLRDILAQHHTTITGMVDTKAAAVKLEIVKMLDQRVKGAVVQTTRNLNVNTNIAPPPAPKIEDVDKRIKELEEALKGLNDGPKPLTLMDIEVQSMEIEGDSG